MTGKVLRIVIAVAMMFACALTPALLKQIPAIQSFALAHENPDDLLESFAVGSCVLLIYGAAVVLALILCYVLGRTLDRGRHVSVGLRIDRRALLWLLGMILAALVVDLVVASMLHALGLAGGDQPVPQGPPWLMIVEPFSIAFLLQGIPEEVIWRGWLFSSLGETRFAAVSSVLGFTALHLISQVGQQNLIEHITYLVLPCGFAVTALIVRLVSGSTGRNVSWRWRGSTWPACQRHQPPMTAVEHENKKADDGPEKSLKHPGHRVIGEMHGTGHEVVHHMKSSVHSDRRPGRPRYQPNNQRGHRETARQN